MWPLAQTSLWITAFSTNNLISPAAYTSPTTFVEPLLLTGAMVSGNTQGHFGNGEKQKTMY